MFSLTGLKWGDSQTVGTPGGTVSWSFATQNFAGETYNFDSFFTREDYKAAIRTAFQTWQAVANITFVESTDAADINIRIGWDTIDGKVSANGTGGQVGESASRFSFINGVATPDSSADIRFDIAEDWSVAGGFNIVSLLNVAIHEIGHSIGLDHVSDPNQIMFGTSSQANQLGSGDIQGVQTIYGAATGGGGGGGTGTATPGNDTINATAGNDNFDGLAGLDTVVMAGNSSAYTFVKNPNGSFTVTGQGTDILTNIERVKFDNGTYALDIAGIAGQAYRIYKAAFARDPDNGGLTFWIGNMDAGQTLLQVAQQFIGAAEFQQKYGVNPTTAALVDAFYQNVLGRAGEAGGVAFWNNQIDSGAQTVAQVLAGFSESPENIAAVGQTIDNGFLYG